jgi:N-acetylneuraminic acid mutarotase
LSSLTRVVLLAVALLPAGTLLSHTDTSGHWISRSPLPTARQEIAHAVLNDRIYIPGGLASGGGASSVVEVYEPATNSWTTIAPLPEALHHMGFAAAHGKLYVLGGYTAA